MIYTDSRYEYKFDKDMFSMSVCFNLSQNAFYDKFCENYFDRKNCPRFSVTLDKEKDKFETKSNTFEDELNNRESQHLNEVFFNFSQLFCISYQTKEKIPNKYFYSIKVCESKKKLILKNLVLRIFIHDRETKPDLKKDYVYKYSYDQEINYSEVNVKFEKYISLLLEKPYWTECRRYTGNSTRGECIDNCFIRKFKLRNKNSIDLIDDQYELIKKNKTARSKCIRLCSMPCESAFYIMYSVTKSPINEMNKSNSLMKTSDRTNQLNPINKSNNCRIINLIQKDFYNINQASSLFHPFYFFMDMR